MGLWGSRQKRGQLHVLSKGAGAFARKTSDRDGARPKLSCVEEVSAKSEKNFVAHGIAAVLGLFTRAWGYGELSKYTYNPYNP